MAGQTLSQVRALLDSAGLSPQHRFGQNFLIDLNLMRKLLDAAEIGDADVVLEVGPGTGSLTELLLATGARVVAAEIDRGLQELLRSQFAGNERFCLVAGDALAGKHAVNAEVLAAMRERVPGDGGGYKLAANLPYQIATPLLLDLLLLDRPLARMACTIQKEVAERLTADAGGDAYGPVSIIMAALADVQWIAKLPPTVFWPRPNVDSAMVLITPKRRDECGIADVAAFVDLVRRAFLHRRQTMRRIVSRWENAEAAVSAMTRLELDSNLRPGDVRPAEWRSLANVLCVPSSRPA